MSDTTLTINGNTVNTGDALLQLDALISGYAAILEQATKQLESMSLSDDQLARVTRDTLKGLNYYNLGRTVAQAIAEPDDDQRAVIDKVVTEVADKVREDWLTPMINRIVGSQIHALKSSLVEGVNRRIDEAVESRINSVDAQARRCNRDMADALSHLLGKEIRDAVTNEIAPWRTSVEELVKKAESTTTTTEA
jgi:hypothetical protein